jgi:hypothetical protein
MPKLICFYLFTMYHNIHLLTGYEGNITFIVPKVPTIVLGVALDNSWYLGDNKSDITLILVVYRSSETSTNQSDVIIRSDDRFLNLVIDSDSIVSKIYMLNFVLWLFLFLFCLHTDQNIAVLSQLVYFALIVTNIW